MTDVIAASAKTPPAAESTESAAPAELSDLEKIKAAQASRRSRRSRGPTATPTPSTDSSAGDMPALAASGEAAGDASVEVEKMRQEAATLRLEMSSLRRNHLHNLKKVTEERDMFASQLAREQATSGSTLGAAEKRKVADLEVQLRAARTRNNDLEAENGVLRDDVKQLNFRVQASKTLDAATNGYERIVDELVSVKLKCAQLQEEKEDLLRINKELTQTSAVLTDANGELEKSRSQWVVQCAGLEKERAELETKLKMLERGVAKTEERRKSQVKDDTSYDGSDLQDIKLN